MLYNRVKCWYPIRMHVSYNEKTPTKLRTVNIVAISFIYVIYYNELKGNTFKGLDRIKKKKNETKPCNGHEKCAVWCSVAVRFSHAYYPIAMKVTEK